MWAFYETIDLQKIAWVGTAAAAMLAAINLKRAARQAQATFLLGLTPIWQKDLKSARDDLRSIRDSVAKVVAQTHAPESPQREVAFREEFGKQVSALLASGKNASGQAVEFYTYLNFFEFMGLMVNRRYVGLKDIYLLYKGPIIELDDVFRPLINEWQTQYGLPPGLYANLLDLVRRVRQSERREKWWENSGFTA